MKWHQTLSIILLALVVFLLCLILYKQYSWKQEDILNAATLFGLITATIALLINAKQYGIEKEKRLYELGEFRIEKVYKSKINRIHTPKIPIIINPEIPNKVRVFELTPSSIHTAQHHLINYLRTSYEKEIPIGEIYSPDSIRHINAINKEFVNTLKAFHDGIKHYSPWIFGYHRQLLSIIEAVRKDRKMSIEQKESFISNILLNDMLGYNMIVHEKQTNNFKIVSSVSYEPLVIATVGYLDFIKSILPPKEDYMKALAEYHAIFERDLPK